MPVDPALNADWFPVASSEQLALDKPLAARLLGEDLVLWRNAGRIMAWQDLCLHRGARLSMGQIDPDEGTLACPYHGWRYGASGACAYIPAHPEQQPPTRAVVKSYQVTEECGLIWVCLGQPVSGVPAFAEWSDASYRKILCGPYSMDAAGPRLIENFLDVAHFPFVHETYLGDRAHAALPDYEAEITSDGVIAHDIRVWQPDPDGTGVGSFVSYTYQALRPLTARFTKHSGQPHSSGPHSSGAHTGGHEFAILLTVTPVEERRSLAWMWIAMNYAFDVPAAEIRAFQDQIVAQDVPIVESQRPEALPLDLQAELHLRSDRTAIAYRRWLRELGWTFGVA